VLRAELGPDLAEQSYVVLHELPTESYGRGGPTRAERDRRGQTKAPEPPVAAVL
jgi:hypothetical protein